MSSSPSSDDSTIPPYPSIDPTTFDLVVSGTGLASSLLAAAASAAGKSVLHLDPNPFYGSHFSSLSPSSFSSFLLDGSSGGGPHLYSHVSAADDDSLLPEASRRSILLDLAVPRLLYCAGPMVDLMLRSGASYHVEFKSVDGSLIYDDSSPSSSERMFRSVPDSREKIFKDKSLGPMDRNRMMRFLKLVQAHIANPEDDESRVSDEDLEIPFVDFLHKQKLPPKIRTIFLYAIALADYDQEGGEGCKRVISTREGIDRIALYIKSVGRFPNALGAFLYPIYGHGELPQAFCRCAAVKGALYVLRMPVVALLEDEEKKHCRGVRLASGQEIYSQQVIMEPSIRVPFLESSPIPEVLNTSSLNKKVARGVCIANCSIQQDLSNILVIFPPRSLYPEQMTTVRALQLSSNVSVCPPELFVVYFSTPCDDATVGKECIHAALKAVFSLPDPNNSDGGITENGDAKESKPKLLWSVIYVQELTQASLDSVCLCPMPDANLDYRDLLESTMKLFSQMYPQEEFLPVTADSEIAEDDGGLSD